MNIVNLTPHALNIQREDGTMLEIPASGQIARCAEAREPRPSIDGIAVSVATYGDVTGLPEPVDGTIYVVSSLVLAAVPHRHDVYAPGPALRDEGGKIIGCVGLSANNSQRVTLDAVHVDALLWSTEIALDAGLGNTVDTSATLKALASAYKALRRGKVFIRKGEGKTVEKRVFSLNNGFLFYDHGFILRACADEMTEITAEDLEEAHLHRYIERRHFTN